MDNMEKGPSERAPMPMTPRQEKQLENITPKKEGGDVEDLSPTITESGDEQLTEEINLSPLLEHEGGRGDTPETAWEEKQLNDAIDKFREKVAPGKKSKGDKDKETRASEGKNGTIAEALEAFRQRAPRGGGNTADTKDPAEKFIEELELGALLPKEFETLDEGQKLKVVEDLRRRIVDLVETDAQTQYSEELKKGWYERISDTFMKKFEVGIKRGSAYREIIGTDDGKKIIAENLDILIKKTKGETVYIDKSGKPVIAFLATSEKPTKEETAAVYEFNEKANAFAALPYEWGQERKTLIRGHKREYEKARAEYEQARNVVLALRAGYGKTKEEKTETTITLSQLDSLVQMEQLINTHPEFEKALEKMSEKDTVLKTSKDAGVIFGGIANTLTLKNWTNRALAAGGFGIRMTARGAAALTGVTGITFLGNTAAGAVIGGLRGKIRGKETLRERQKYARYGQKDESEEKALMTNVERLSDRLDDLVKEVEGADTDEERAKKLSLLSARIEHTQGKIENGQVNFGDVKSSLLNQFNLINNLNKALVLRETMSGQTNTELKKKIDGLLSTIGESAAEKTFEAQKKFVRKQMWKGAIIGAGFATVGYVARWAGEQFGWWGHGAEHITRQHGAALTHPVSHSPQPSPQPAAEHLQNASRPAEPIFKKPEDISTARDGSLTHQGGAAPRATEHVLPPKAHTPEHVPIPEHPVEHVPVPEHTAEHVPVPGHPAEHVPPPANAHSAVEAPKDQPAMDKVNAEKASGGDWKFGKPHTIVIDPMRQGEGGMVHAYNQPYAQPYNQPNGPYNGFGNVPPHHALFPGLTMQQNTLLNMHPEFIENPYTLTGSKLLAAFEASKADMQFLTEHGVSGTWDNVWRGLGSIKARDLLAEKNFNTEGRVIHDYLTVLKNFSNLKPKVGFLGFEPESAQHYIARALQKLTAEGKLSDFETSVRK